MQEYNIQSILDEPIAFDAIVPTQQTTQLKALISQMVAEETARQSVERDALIDRLRVELKCERQKRKALEARLDNTDGQLEDLQIITGRERAFDRRRIFKLENRDKTVTSATGPAYADKLCKLMSQSRTHLISVSNAAKLLSITTRHAHRLKPSLLADSRFAIVKDPHHKQRHLIRII